MEKKDRMKHDVKRQPAGAKIAEVKQLKSQRTYREERRSSLKPTRDWDQNDTANPHNGRKNGVDDSSSLEDEINRIERDYEKG